MSCNSGPTVYDSAHIGHASTYVRLDIIQRILRDYFDINLVTCMNITNIDDKIINRSKQIGKNWRQLADEYENEFWEDLNRLNVVHPDIKLRVTEKIPEIIKFIEGIERKQMTKVGPDGSVYFKTTCYQNYGKLHNVSLTDPSTSEFALWKAAKEDEPFWESKYGNGRPGWHIECSTLASLVFGSQIDFHAGGIDLKFPHHENEEAQSCVYHNCQDWVTNWIHTGSLHLKGHQEKMSKSLRNTVSIHDLLREYTCDQFRMACILSHYRSSIEFGPELMDTASKILRRITSFKADARAFINGLKISGFIDDEVLTKQLKETVKNVDAALKEDFHTAVCIGHLSELMKVASKMINSTGSCRNSSDSSKALLQAVLNYIDKMLSIFGISESNLKLPTNDEVKVENLIDAIIHVRNNIRIRAKESKSKELFQICDEIRNELKENQIEIKDHGNLSSWAKIK